MITKQEIVNRHKDRDKHFKSGISHFSSRPEPMFNEDGTYNVYNWSGGDAVIREYTAHINWETDNTKFKDFMIVNEYGEMEGRFNASISWHEDYSYVQMVSHYLSCEKNDDICEWIVDQYLILYYKNRGNTNKIIKNGRLINFDEYIELLNIIEATGFEFDLRK